MKKLDRQQMKNLKGGIVPDEGNCQCENPGGEGPITGGDSPWAQQCASEAGGHWCCASCCTATWSDKTGCP